MKGKWWNVKSVDRESGELLLYGEIGDGWWSENQSRGFIDAIRDLGDIKLLTIRINSIGGDVFAGQAIYNFLKSRKFSKTVLVDGLAASIASVVAMAGDRIIVPVNAMMMIHNPWSLAAGEAADMRKEAELLDKVRDQIAWVYVERTGKNVEEILDLMAAETWMTGEEAVSLGFADEIGEPVEVAASVLDGKFVLSAAAGEIVVSEERMDAFHKKDVAAFFPRRSPSVEGEKDKREDTLMNLEEFKEKYPELYAGVLDEGRVEGMKAGVEKERGRLQALDDLSQPGTEDLIAKAKYDDPRTPEECALELLKAKRNYDAMSARKADAADVNKITGLAPEDIPGSEDREMASFLDVIKNVSSGARASARAFVRGGVK